MLLHVIKPTLPQSPNIPNIHIKKKNQKSLDRTTIKKKKKKKTKLIKELRNSNLTKKLAMWKLDDIGFSLEDY